MRDLPRWTARGARNSATAEMFNEILPGVDYKFNFWKNKLFGFLFPISFAEFSSVDIIDSFL